MKLNSSMELLISILISFTFATAAIGQANSGFTNKAEAKNQMVNGVKEGKWMENAPFFADFYLLTIYKAGKPFGIQREYYPSGKLYIQSTYRKGKKNGLEKRYNESGQLEVVSIYVDDKKNGIEKVYFASADQHAISYINGKKTEWHMPDSLNGKLFSETPYVNGIINGLEKEYDYHGKIEFETTYTNGKRGPTKCVNNPIQNK
jgi:antitoxin component YwqK of YwqJK toxin-antitoxin module